MRRGKITRNNLCPNELHGSLQNHFTRQNGSYMYNLKFVTELIAKSVELDIILGNDVCNLSHNKFSHYAECYTLQWLM